MHTPGEALQPPTVELHWKILFLMCMVMYIFSINLFFFFSSAYWIKTWVPNADLGDEIFWIKQQQSAAFDDLYEHTSALSEYLSSSFRCSINLSADTLMLSLLLHTEKLRKLTMGRFSEFCCTVLGNCRRIHSAGEMCLSCPPSWSGGRVWVFKEDGCVKWKLPWCFRQGHKDGSWAIWNERKKE